MKENRLSNCTLNGSLGLGIPIGDEKSSKVANQSNGISAIAQDTTRISKAAAEEDARV